MTSIAACVMPASITNVSGACPNTSTISTAVVVIATMKTWLVLGIASAVAGLIALTTRQPYEVWFLLLLPALILTGLSARSLKDYQRRYEELELRKMASVDAR